eukprot:XP_001708156.1 Hypothetical protein GL50803_92268 [Giardia lamblia ATCC 50803]
MLGADRCICAGVLTETYAYTVLCHTQKGVDDVCDTEQGLVDVKHEPGSALEIARQYLNVWCISTLLNYVTVTLVTER